MRARDLQRKRMRESAHKTAKRMLASRVAAFLVCAAFALAMLYHSIVPLDALPFDEGIEGQDCAQMVWNLWHVNEAITMGRNPYRTENIYYPAGARLGHHTLAAGFFPVTFLVKKLSGNDPFYPFYAYRISILLSFTLLLYFSFQLLRELGFTLWACLIPAVAYAFCDFYMEHLIHLNYLAGFFIPLVAVLFVRLYKKPSTRNALWTALAASCAIYFTELVLYIYMGALLFALLMLLFSNERKILIGKIRRAGLKRIALASASFLLVMSPFLYNFLGDTAVRKPLAAESSFYSSNLAGFFVPARKRTALYGNAFQSLATRITKGMGEPGIFAGFPLIIFAVIALVRVKQKLMVIAALASLMFFVLSLGPTLKVFNVDTSLPMPYALLMRAPPFDLGRTPVRFVAMGMFFLMIVAASGVMLTEKKLRERRSDARWREIMAASVMPLLLLWTIAETYSPTARQQSFIVPPPLARIVDGPVLNLPLERNDGYSSMLQIFHHQPIATGFLARYTEAQWNEFIALEKIFNRGGAQFCDQIKTKGFRNIVIAPEKIVPRAPSLAPLELSRCQINVVDLRKEDGASMSASEGEAAVERPRNFPLYGFGTRVNFAAAEAEPFLWYGWSGGETSFRWTDRGRAAISFALAGKVETSVLRIRLAPFLVPGKLDRQQVDVRLNDQSIKTLTLVGAGTKEYELTLPENALRERNVLSFDLPDAASPKDFGLSDDDRMLGVRVEWLEIAPQRFSK